MPAFAGSSVFSGSAFAGGTVFEAAVVGPSAPASVTLTANTGTTATFLVVPGAVAGDSYTLQLETPSGAGNWTTPAGSWAGTTFNATGLMPATSYRARASATNGVGTSAYTLSDPFATDNTGSGAVPAPAPPPGPTPPPAPSAPSISVQPQPQAVTEGALATFSVTALGTAPLAYQWRFNGANVGTNSSTYGRTTTLADNSGVVSVTVSNSAGSVVSANAALGVFAAAPSGPVVRSAPPRSKRIQTDSGRS